MVRGATANRPRLFSIIFFLNDTELDQAVWTLLTVELQMRVTVNLDNRASNRINSSKTGYLRGYFISFELNEACLNWQNRERAKITNAGWYVKPGGAVGERISCKVSGEFC